MLLSLTSVEYDFLLRAFSASAAVAASTCADDVASAAPVVVNAGSALLVPVPVAVAVLAPPC
jgi:hypothetical protein